MCYFEQIQTPDRDQISTQKALETFGRLVRDYPQDQYALVAKEYINSCLRSLATSELYIGKFYFKSKHYRAALRRFKNVITRYPDVGIHQEALRYLAVTESKMAKQSTDAGSSLWGLF